MIQKTCCFFGHREIIETEELKKEIYDTIAKLIVNEKVEVFLFGSESRFNDLCHEIVSRVKVNYPHIKRVYVRAEFPSISDSYKAYLLKDYEETYYPENITGAGRAVYVERNCEMIDNSRFCIVYCQEEYEPHKRKSGTKKALAYAVKKQRVIYQFPKTATNFSRKEEVKLLR